MRAESFHAVVYGPIKSRRLGLSLGINPTPTSREQCPDKGCVFCDQGLEASVPIISRVNQVPSAGVVVTSAARRIIEMSRGGDKLESITVSGNNDPTMHPAFREITENLRALRDKWFSKAKLCLLSDSSSLETDDLRHAILIYDKPIVTFEWGTAKTFSARTGRPGTDLKTIIEKLAGLEKLIVQATFNGGPDENSSDKEVTAWIKKLEELRPREVYVQSVGGGKRGGPRKVPDSRLESIASKVTDQVGVPCTALTLQTQPA